MLSQLLSGHRANIGNPVAVARLAAVRDLAGEAAGGRVTWAAAADRMEDVRASAASPLTGRGSVPASATPAGAARPVPPGRVVRDVHSLLRSPALAADPLAAVGALAADHPELAEFLRVYGTGRTGEAVAHFEAHQY